MNENIYTSGEYLANNPDWHAEDSVWKAEQIFKMIKRNNIILKTICDVGCGAGEILKQLQRMMSSQAEFWGYDISPQAFDLCKDKANENLHFKLKDIMEEQEVFFDVILIIDLIEHLEDYFCFLREIKKRSKYVIFHIPLDLSVQGILRSEPFINSYEKAGHIHFFTKDIALNVIKDMGYEIIDYFYTASGIDRPGKSFLSRLSRLPRKILFWINADLAVRIVGGYSLLILAQ